MKARSLPFPPPPLAAAVRPPLAAGKLGKKAREDAIPALRPRDDSGRYFVMYSDCCSGVPGGRGEKNLAIVNKMVKRLTPQPEFISFPGDAICGSSNTTQHRKQWDHWLGAEMAWIKERKLKLWQSTSNHNTPNPATEDVFRAVHPELPQNGPEGQKGLAYWVRDGNLLYVSLHKWSGNAPTALDWLDKVLRENADAAFKFVVAHFPCFPVNSYIGYPTWTWMPEQRKPFWDVLVKHRIDAYLCSHVIAFDVQVHDGILHICSSGAGTEFGPGGFMPGQSEYFHATQIAVDKQGLRYQVHDGTGALRERLNWPFELPPAHQWEELTAANLSARLKGIDVKHDLLAFRCRGENTGATDTPQTFLCGAKSDEGVEPVWIGIDAGRLAVNLVPVSGAGWQTWRGPKLKSGEAFDIQVAIHPHMGPGGVLYRANDGAAWSSLESTSSKGTEDMRIYANWLLGNAQSGLTDRPFTGDRLNVTFVGIKQKGSEGQKGLEREGK